MEQTERDVVSDSCTQEMQSQTEGNIECLPSCGTGCDDKKTIQELEKSYADLRAAFTRKTQELVRIKQQAEKQSIFEQEGKDAAGDVAEATKENEKNAEEIAPPAPQTAEPVNAEEVIKHYLQSVAQQKVPPVIANFASNFAYTNLGEAKSISQVEKIVTNFFETKGKGS